jgi:hypothetical protein
VVALLDTVGGGDDSSEWSDTIDVEDSKDESLSSPDMALRRLRRTSGLRCAVGRLSHNSQRVSFTPREVAQSDINRRHN